MATPKTSQLSNLASQFPAMAQQTAATQQAQARMAATQAVQEQAQGFGPRRPISAAQMGAELYTAQAAAAREAQQRAQRGMLGVGKMELDRQQQEKQKLLFDRAQGINADLRKQEQQLQRLNSEVKSNLYDKAMQFQKNEVGRTIWKTSQLMDYAARKTQRAEDYRNLQMRVGQLQKRRTQLLRTAQAKIQQALKQEYAKSEAVMDRDLKDRLTKAANAIKTKLREEQNAARERSAAWGAMGEMIGTTLGVIAGAAITVATAGAGLPAAAATVAAGASIGGMIGKSLGGGTASLAEEATREESKPMTREEIRSIIRGGR